MMPWISEHLTAKGPSLMLLRPAGSTVAVYAQAQHQDAAGNVILENCGHDR